MPTLLFGWPFAGWSSPSSPRCSSARPGRAVRGRGRTRPGFSAGPGPCTSFITPARAALRVAGLSLAPARPNGGLRMPRHPGARLRGERHRLRDRLRHGPLPPGMRPLVAACAWGIPLVNLFANLLPAMATGGATRGGSPRWCSSPRRGHHRPHWGLSINRGARERLKSRSRNRLRDRRFGPRNGSPMRPKIRSTIRYRIGRIVGPFPGRDAGRIRAAVVRDVAPFRPRPPLFGCSTGSPPSFPAHALAPMKLRA